MKSTIMLICMLVAGCNQEKEALVQDDLVLKTAQDALKKQNHKLITELVSKNTFLIRKERTELVRTKERPKRSDETRRSCFDFLSENSVVFDNKVKEI